MESDLKEDLSSIESLKIFRKDLQTLFNSLDDFIFILDYNGNILSVNSSVVKSLKYSKEELIGKSVLTVHPPEQHEEGIRILGEMINGTREICPIPLFTKDGSLIPVETKVTKGKWGDQDALFGISRDITERQKFENALKKSEEKYRELYEKAPIAFFSIGIDKKINHFNNAALKLLGYSEDELPNLTVYDLYADTDYGLTKAKHIFIQFTNGEIIQDEILQMKKKNGEIIWVSLTVNPVLNDSGEIIESRSIVIDINEQRKIEEKLRFTQFSLDNSGEPAFWMDSKAKLIYVNDAASKSLGYTREELLNMTVHDFDPDFPAEAWPEHWEEVRKKGSFTLESHHRNKAGKVFPVEITVNYLEFEGKEYNCAFARDISQRKESERKLRNSEEKSREAFDQANLYKDIFAHDINNILQNIQSSLELSLLYLNNPEKSSTVKELYGIIKEQVSRGSKLISNVRKLSTLHESVFSLKPIRVNKTLKESIKFLKQSFQTRKINIQFTPKKKEFFVYANELLLDIFENLLLNAVRHNSNVNVKIEISVSKEDVEGKKFIKIQFIDNGDGIEDIRKKYIFQRGSKEKSSNGGMGLGLSLVKKTIDRYDGKIWVQDRVKGDSTKGSNFVLLIPEGL
ncbi:MAG: PAS domain S-box protein [Candidatus Hermodarchaeota archaeon]